MIGNKTIISKSELARAFGRNSQAFWRQVHNDDDLMQLLSKTRYVRVSHCVTNKQALLIAEYYGFDIHDNTKATESRTTI